MTVRFIGCLHLGHHNIAKHRGWENAEEQDEFLIQEWNKVVKKKDTTYIVGDVTMEKALDYYKLDQLNGRKIVCLGNHDRYQNVKELLLYVDGVAWQAEKMYSQDEILMAMGYAIGVSGRGSLSHEEVKSSCIDFIEALNKK